MDVSNRTDSVLGYRLYFFEDAQDGHHIRQRVEFDGASDEEALRTAESHADGRHMELWCGARLLRIWSEGGGEP